jgi:hypothetical protein
MMTTRRLLRILAKSNSESFLLSGSLEDPDLALSKSKEMLSDTDEEMS